MKTKQQRKRRAGSRPEKTRKLAAIPPHSPEWNLLNDEVAFLREAVCCATGPRWREMHDMLSAVTAYRHDLETENDDPDGAVFVAALDKFYALPEAERRQLLRGWQMNRWPAPDGLDETDDTHPMLTIDAGRFYANGLAYAEREFVHADMPAPVRLQVLVGTPKEKVIEALWSLWQVVETQWPALSALDDPIRVVHEPLPIALHRITAGLRNPPHWLDRLDRHGVIAPEVETPQAKEVA
jgi:hypothetical protein